MLFRRVKKTIDRYHLLDRDDRIIVAVSSGVDSMVMLHLLNALREDLGLSLIVAHVNHGLRPDESNKEAELVEQESTRLGLPFEYGRFDAQGISAVRQVYLFKMAPEGFVFISSRPSS